MDDLQRISLEKVQCQAHLLAELFCQIQADALKAGVPQQIVQVVGEQLEHQTQMVAPGETAVQSDDLVLAALQQFVAFTVEIVHEFEEENLSLDDSRRREKQRLVS